MANPTYVLFGDSPTAVKFASSAQLDGAPVAGSVVPTVSAGVMEFPPQAANTGRASHDVLVEVINITYEGGGTLTVTKNQKVGDAVTATISDLTKAFYLLPSEYLKCVTAGASNPKVTIFGRALPPGRCM